MVSPTRVFASLHNYSGTDEKQFFAKIDEVNECLIKFNQKMYQRIPLLNKEISAFSSFEIAIFLGNMALCRKLYYPAMDCQIPLCFAIATGQAEIAQFLFEKSSVEEKITAIKNALVFEKPDIFNGLWDIASQEIKECKIDGYSFLQFSINQACKPVFFKLFKQATLPDQLHVLNFIIHLKKEDTFNSLWDTAVAEAKVYNADGVSWIKLAITLNLKEVVFHLLRKNFNVRFVDFKGHTPLYYALTAEYQHHKIIEAVAQKDQGLTNELETCRLFGHRFSLSGPFFEGINEKRVFAAVHAIIQSIHAFSLQNDWIETFSSTHCAKTLQIFQNSLNKDVDFLTDHAQKNGSLVRTHWSTHATGYIICHKIFVKINTAKKSTEGFKLYEMRCIDEKTIREAISCIIKDSKEKVPLYIGIHELNKKLKSSLDLVFIRHVKFEQRSGNCVWSLLKAVYLALIILQNSSDQGLTNDRIEKAYPKLYAHFNMWDNWDRRESANGAQLILKKYPTIFNLSHIYSEMILKSIEERVVGHLANFIEDNPQYKDWQHPENGKSLIRYAFAHYFLDLVPFLVRMSCDFNLKDFQGETLFDDLRKKPLNAEEKELVLAFAKHKNFTENEFQELNFLLDFI